MRHRTDSTAATPRLVVVLAFEGRNSSTWPGRCRLSPAPMKSPIKYKGRARRAVPGGGGVAARRSGHDDVGAAAGHPAAGRTLGKARIDTLIIPGGGGVQNAVKEAATVEWVRRQAGIGSPHRVGLHRRVPARRSRRARRPARHDALAILRPAGSSSTPTSKSTPIRSMSATGGFGPRPASPPASI